MKRKLPMITEPLGEHLRRIGRALWAMALVGVGVAMLSGGSIQELVLCTFLLLNACLALGTLIWSI